MTKKLSKPMIISIHGDGIEIVAKIARSPQISQTIEQLITRFQGGVVPVPAPVSEGKHAFDTVQSVIKHSNPVVLKAIIDLVNNELEQRGSEN